jgi:hypothetical protein
MTMLEIALECTRRGWYVFPCWPKSKKPMTERGFKDATNDEAQVRAWWSATPNANVAIATGPSKLCVVDVDHGIKDVVDLVRWMTEKGLPPTYWVRTGRRPEFGAQLYYSGEGLKSTGWRDGDISGDIRCSTGYVMAAGSIHPDSGEEYEGRNSEVQVVPEYVKTLTSRANDPSMVTTVDDDTADDWKTWLLEYMDRNKIEPRDYEKRAPNGYWLGIHCPWEHQHSTGAGAESSTVLGILDGKLAFECSHGTCKANKRDTAAFKAFVMDRIVEPGADLGITLGSGNAPLPKDDAEPVDWREHYHSFDEVNDTPDVDFLIENFLPRESITAIAAPVGQRKSLIAMNVAKALVSGEPLFGKFAVLQVPERVIYLCPEMGIRSFVKRIRNLGMVPFAGKTLFVRTMNKRDVLKLEELTPEEIRGSVIIIDTLVRYIKGDENSSKDMACLSAQLFRLIEEGAAAVIPLHHSQKGTKETPELTLENVMRGSGELGASMTNVWATRLQDPNEPYKSPSYLKNVKPRDYDPKPIQFEVCGTGSEDDARLTFVDSDIPVTLKSKATGNRDGKADAALSIIKANPDRSIAQLEAMLKAVDIKRGHNWIATKKRELFAKGATHTEDA